MLGMLHLFLNFFVLALLRWLNADFWAMYGHVLLVFFGSEKSLYKIDHVGIGICLTVSLNIFCTYIYFLTAEPWSFATWDI
jgi:hypothetical protein